MREPRQITVETHTVTIIKTKNGRRSRFCEHCGELLTDISRPQIAALLQLPSTEMSADPGKDRKE